MIKERHIAITKFTPISLVVLLLLRLVEPRTTRLLTLALPMLLSRTTLADSKLLGKSTLSKLGVLIFGLGVDLILLVRMREEQQIRPFEEALLKTILGAGPAIVAGAATTIGAFTLIGLADDPVAKHLGVSAAIGLVTCLLLMLTLLPAMWVVFYRKQEVGEPIKPLNVPFLPSLTNHAVGNPRIWVFGFTAWVIIALAGLQISF